MWPFKKCQHEWNYRKIYGDEIHLYGGKRDLWTCSKCGKRTTKASALILSEIERLDRNE